MFKDFNLLHKTEEHQYRPRPRIADNVMNDLKVYRLLEYFTGLTKHDLSLGTRSPDDLDYAFNVLREPCQVAGDILYRQQIFAQLSKDNAAVRMYNLLCEAVNLEKTRNGYDFSDITGADSPYNRTMCYVYFLEIYKRFTVKLAELLSSLDIAEGEGLDGLRAEAETARKFVLSDEYNKPCADFLAFYVGKRVFYGELRMTRGAFTEFNFVFDPGRIESSYPEGRDFTALLGEAEAAVGLSSPETAHNGEKGDIEVFKGFNTFEKRLMDKLSSDDDITGGEAPPEDAIRAVAALHEQADIGAFLAMREQMRFYYCISAMTDIIRRHTVNPFGFAQPGAQAEFDLHGMYDPVVAVQKLAEKYTNDRGIIHADAVAGDIVPNALSFAEKNIFVVSGPNNGGKTAFARAAGLCMILHGAGCPIPAEGGIVGLNVLPMTHFTADETHRESSGRLADELARLDAILAEADKTDVLILNETFAGTNSVKALALFEEYAKKITEIGCRALYVTHFHNIAFHIEDRQSENDPEYAGFGNLIAQIDAATGRRLYKILPLNPSDTSFSRDIVARHRLTWEQLEQALVKGAET